MTPMPFEEAVSAVLAQSLPLPTTELPIEACVGRFLATPLTTPVDIPRETASLMDGYAVRSAEAVPGAALTIAFEIPAGRVAPRALQPGECARIFTGAPLPEGADAVVMQERCTRTGDTMTPQHTPPTGEHVRHAGSDARSGEELLPAATAIDAGVVSLAASVGLTHLPVRPSPRVALLVTGDELRPPGSTLAPGQIYESNSYGLAQQARDAGADCVILRPAPDALDELHARLSDVKADIIVTSGGASVGDYDFAPQLLERLGGRQLFRQVAIRPGRPVIFGVIPTGIRPTLFFALPGNPGASALTFDLFVRPAIRCMAGALRLRRPRLQARLEGTLKKPAELTFLARGRLWSREGQLIFTPAPQQGSMSIRSLAALNAVALIAPGVTTAEPGSLVEVEPWGLVDDDTGVVSDDRRA